MTTLKEFSPGLDTELLPMLQATAELELSDVVMSYGPITPAGAVPAAH